MASSGRKPVVQFSVNLFLSGGWPQLLTVTVDGMQTALEL